MHWGLDIANEIDEPFYAMYSGRVVGRDFEEDLGYYVKVQAKIDGKFYLLQFGHLKKDGRPSNGSDINAGDIIGYQGLSGNLKDAILDGSTNQPHSHFSVKEKLPNNDWNHDTGFSDPVNPEDVMTTKFDDSGNPINSTDC